MSEPILNPFEEHLKNCDVCPTVCGTFGTPLRPEFSSHLCPDGQMAYYQQPQYNKIERTDLTVTCSCGRTGSIVKQRVNDPYVATSWGWKFRGPNELRGPGWYCGNEEHEQADSENAESHQRLRKAVAWTKNTPRVRTIRDLQSGDEPLPKGTQLRVIMENGQGVRGVARDGHIHVIKPGDYERVTEDDEHNGAEVFLR